MHEKVEKLPNGYVPYEQWPEFDLSNFIFSDFHPKKIGKNPVGVRWGKWGVNFEKYTSDSEPIMTDSRLVRPSPPRCILWYRVSRNDIPKGWYQFSTRPSRLEGIAILKPNTDYTTDWSESARRYRKKWHDNFANKTHVLRQATLEDFKKGYLQSTVLKKGFYSSLKMIDLALRSSANHSEIWVIENINTHVIAAGMITIDSPTYASSYYLTGFVHADETNVPGMTALMDRWFEVSQKAGMSFLFFGPFWQQGKPHHWKGFSDFKSKFGVKYVEYQPTLIRFTIR